MNDPNGSKVGLITDGSRRGTCIADVVTEQPVPCLPFVDGVEYSFRNGVGRLTIALSAAPARIVGVVTSAEWIRHTSDGVEAAPDYVPSDKDNPVGRRVSMEFDGIFASVRPLDEETTAFFRDIWVVEDGFSWKFENGECALHLKCLVRPIGYI